MSRTLLESIKIKAKLLQKAKRRTGKDFKLKDAFELLARAAGFASWRDWREVLEDHEAILPPYASAHWHVWYSSYEKALSDLPKHGGYLLPYQKHFFLCGVEYIESLGISADDPDLERVGRNWARPNDVSAYRRLRARILHKRKGSQRGN